MHNDNVGTYPVRWLDGIVAQERVEDWFSWYSRYMNRFLDHYDLVLSNGPALVKRLGKRGVRVDEGFRWASSGISSRPTTATNGCAPRCWRSVRCRRTRICCWGWGGIIPKSAGRWSSTRSSAWPRPGRSA